jgi:hypothetical protein
VVLRFREPAWNDPAPVAAAQRRLAALPQFASLTGPFDVNGVTLTPGQLTALHATLGGPGALSALPRAGVPAAAWTAYRAEGQGRAGPAAHLPAVPPAPLCRGVRQGSRLNRAPQVRDVLIAVAGSIAA